MASGIPAAVSRTPAASSRTGEVQPAAVASSAKRRDAFGLDTPRASTRALAGHSPGDATYTRIENALQRLGTARDTVGGRMRAMLLGAAFGGRTLNVATARTLIRAGNRLLGQAAVLGA